MVLGSKYNFIDYIARQILHTVFSWFDALLFHDLARYQRVKYTYSEWGWCEFQMFVGVVYTAQF